MIQDLALPVAFTAVLQNVFQFLKPLLEMIPGFRVGDQHHDDLLRFLFCLICFGGAIAFVLQQGMMLDALTLLACFNTAIGMTYGAHLAYKNVAKGGATPVQEVAPADVPSTYPDYPDADTPVEAPETVDTTPLASDVPVDAEATPAAS